MATMEARVPTVPGDANELDRLLADVCEALQITPTQYANAEAKYQAVGRWLAAEESPLASLRPQIYPQGSMALQTTVRPWNDKDSYDLDLVLQVEPTSEDPMALYRMVETRLQLSPHYRDILERKKRCLCLNFVGDDHAFHMDILPARPDEERGDTCIEVPDRKTPEVWQPSNPRGYQKWFESRAVREALLLAERKQEPLPDNDPAYAKAVLKRAVQLMKRRRDLMIPDADLSPRSVVLTTLAGTYYRGERDVTSALSTILTGIKQAIAAARPGRIEVCNPTNMDERFCESFRTDEQYEAFASFIDRFLEEVRALATTVSVPKLQPVLTQMFGETITKRALLEYGKRVSEARERGAVTTGNVGGKAGLVLGTHLGVVGSTPAKPAHSTGRPVPKNTFFGE
jgi:hypothetical protein